MGKARGRSIRGRAAFAAIVALAVASCGWGSTGSADQITDFRAQLRGAVGNTVPGSTSYHFEYGLTTDYGSSTPTRSVQVTDPDVEVPVSQTVTGLAEGTTYHFRLCAVDADGHGVCGEDHTLTTTSGHDYVSGRGVVFSYFQLGLVIGGSVEASSAADGSGATGVAESLPGVRYFRIVDHGPVTCLRVEGNRATIGFLADLVGTGEPDEQPVPMVAFVEDNAAAGTPDRWGSRQVPETLTTCPAATDADFTTPSYESFGGALTSGDFVVHDHDPAPVP